MYGRERVNPFCLIFVDTYQCLSIVLKFSYTNTLSHVFLSMRLSVNDVLQMWGYYKHLTIQIRMLVILVYTIFEDYSS